MKLFLIALLSIGTLSALGCGGSSSNTTTFDPPRPTQGEASVTVEGAINKTTRYSRHAPGTKISCYRQPAINYAHVRLFVPGKSKTLAGVQEGLTITFKNDQFVGGIHYIKDNRVSYVTPNEYYQSTGTDCIALLTFVGPNLQGRLDCNPMIGETGKKISITANFDCDVVTE